MKKLILLICLLVLAAGAYAGSADALSDIAVAGSDTPVLNAQRAKDDNDDEDDEDGGDEDDGDTDEDDDEGDEDDF